MRQRTVATVRWLPNRACIWAAGAPRAMTAWPKQAPGRKMFWGLIADRRPVPRPKKSMALASPSLPVRTQPWPCTVAA